jgi:methionyl aminopeptidase
LLKATETALYAGIDQAKIGNHIGDISSAIGGVARKFHLPEPNTSYGGHGIGRAMHEDPSVPNAGQPGSQNLLREGLVIAIEPWFMLGTNRLVTDPDGWTLRSANRALTAHFEHTLAITASGPQILT